MHIDEQFQLEAKEAIHKKGVIGPDVDLSTFDPTPSPHFEMADDDLLRMPREEQERLLMAGLDVTEKERGGTFLQMNTNAVHCHSSQEGIEVLSIQKALAEHEWVRDYYWKLADVSADKYTAAAQLGLHDGYVIRSLPGSKSVYPVQACLYMHKDGMQQNVHNIIVAEEDSELHIISGCATAPHLKRGLHVGISEFFVKKNAKLTFTMIHNWAEEVMVRPRSVARVEEGGLFINNYISMKPVRSIQMYPTTHFGG